MIWIVALMMAAQAAAPTGAPAQAPALTPEQKRVLSAYKFNAAAAQLKAQPNQSPKLGPSSRIPPLEIPATVSPGSSPSSRAGSAVDKASAVPAGWKPPHAELNQAATNAAAVALAWQTGVGTPTPGADGRVVYVFGQGMPVLVCAPLRVCAIELQAGEHLQSQPQIGDSRRWEITPVMS